MAFPTRIQGLSHPARSLSCSTDVTSHTFALVLDSCQRTQTPAWRGTRVHPAQPRPTDGAAAVDRAQHLLVCVPNAVWSPDASGGEQAVLAPASPSLGATTSCSKFLPALPVLRHRLWPASAHFAHPGDTPGDEHDESKRIWLQEPKATTAARVSDPIGRLHEATSQPWPQTP